MDLNYLFNWLKTHRPILAVIGVMLAFWGGLNIVLRLLCYLPTGVHFVMLLHGFIRKWIIPLLVAGIIAFHLKPKLKPFHRLFHWKIWTVVFAVVTLIAVIGCSQVYIQTGKWYDTMFSIGDYTWQYIPIIEYAIFFAVQLYLWQNRGIPNFHAWTLSFMGCYVTSQLYEVAWFIAYNNNDTLFYQVTQSALFVFLLFAVGWKPKKAQVIPLLFLVGFWVVAFFLPNTNWRELIWLPRFAPMPLIASIALTYSPKT